MNNNFIRTSDRLPEKGKEIEWITPSGDGPVMGKYLGGVAWMMTPEGIMVYYKPIS